MSASSKDAGTIQVLVHRLNTQRLPYALKLKAKVDRGETLSTSDKEFLARVQKDAGEARKLADKHTEYQELLARVTSLYTEITSKALENEQKSSGAGA